MKTMAKDGKRKQLKIKDLSAKKDVKGGTGTRIADRDGNIGGSGGKLPLR